MRWSLKIAKISGIEVRVHVTFLLLLAFIGYSYYRVGGMPAAKSGIAFVLLIFLCVLLHEFGHALAARRFNIKTPDITLLPIGGVARLERMPDKPWQELVVAVAGPAVNLVIAAALFLVVGIGVNFSISDDLANPTGDLMTKVAVVNVLLAVFNMIPAFPMDGGRVLRALLAMNMPYRKATQIAARVGQGFAFLLGFAGLFGNPFLIFIALFVYLGASQENTMAQMKDATSGLHVADAMVTEVVTLTDRSTIDDAVEALLRTSQHEFPVLDADEKVRGILTREPMIRALRASGPEALVSEAMQSCERTVHPQDNFEGAFRLMQESGCPALPVVDEFDRFVGLITPENVGEMMMVKSILKEGERPSWRESAPS